MCRVGWSGYIILLIILIILYKYIYIYYILPLFFWGPPLRDTIALFLQLQLQMQIFSAWHSGSVVARKSLWKWSEG